ncbi:MAG: hypothetical protein ABFD64_08535 [Armatimonadota bacterium]
MRKSILIAMAVIFIVGILAISASAQSDDKNQPRITIELKDTPIRSALDTLFRGRGLSYSIGANVGGNVGSLSLRDVTFDVALKMLLKAVEPPLVYRKDGDVYVITVKSDQPDTSTFTPPTADINPPDTTEAEDVKMEKISLSFVDAYDLKAIIEGQNTSRSSNGSNGSNGSWGSGSSGNWGGSSGGSGNWGGSSGGSGSWGGGSSSWSNSNSGNSYGRYSGRSGY